MQNNRNPQNRPLRKLLTAGELLVERSRDKGDAESLALADVWTNLIEQCRQKKLLGVQQ